MTTSSSNDSTTALPTLIFTGLLVVGDIMALNRVDTVDCLTSDAVGLTNTKDDVLRGI
jgi:hypothetical protein